MANKINERNCYICNLPYYDYRKKDEIRKNNVFLNNYKPYKPFTNSGLSNLAHGNIDAIKIYFEENLKETSYLFENNLTKVKLVQACDCESKQYHPDCLVKHCLLNQTFDCSDCASAYSISFKERSLFACGKYLIYLICLVLMIISLVIVAILLINHNITLVSRQELKHLDIILGVSILFISVIVLSHFVSLLRSNKEETTGTNYVIKDKSAIRNKKTTTYFRNDKLNDTKEPESTFYSSSLSHSQIDQCLFYSKKKLGLSLFELAELKLTNHEYISLLLNNENKIINQIQESNEELKVEQKQDSEDKVDVLLKEDEKPKKIYSSLIPRRISKINIPKEDKHKVKIRLHEQEIEMKEEKDNRMIIMFDEKQINESQQNLKRENSFSKKNIEAAAYNNLCRKQNKRKTEKKNNLPPIYNLNIKLQKKEEEEQKISLLGGVIKKKREKEEKQKQKILNESTRKKSRIEVKHKEKIKVNLLGNYLKKVREEKNKDKAKDVSKVNSNLLNPQVERLDVVKRNSQRSCQSPSIMRNNSNVNLAEKNVNSISPINLAKKKVDFTLNISGLNN